MPDVALRKIMTVVETIQHEFGPPPANPLCRCAAIAVIKNPYAGGYHPDIEGFMEDLKPLGLRLAHRALAVLGGDKNTVSGYGKGSIVGVDGELEHGALWHVPGGYAMRELLGNAAAIVPSTKKVGVAGARLDIPITHINASYVRSHFDAMEVGLNDAPRADELAFVLVMTTGARIHARVGGLGVDDIIGKDGLR